MSFADGDEQNAAKAQFLFLMKIVSSLTNFPLRV